MSLFSQKCHYSNDLIYQKKFKKGNNYLNEVNEKCCAILFVRILGCTFIDNLLQQIANYRCYVILIQIYIYSI